MGFCTSGSNFHYSSVSTICYSSPFETQPQNTQPLCQNQQQLLSPQLNWGLQKLVMSASSNEQNRYTPTHLSLNSSTLQGHLSNYLKPGNQSVPDLNWVPKNIRLNLESKVANEPECLRLRVHLDFFLCGSFKVLLLLLIFLQYFEYGFLRVGNSLEYLGLDLLFFVTEVLFGMTLMSSR